jgi:hypothetical protein
MNRLPLQWFHRKYFALTTIRGCKNIFGLHKFIYCMHQRRLIRALTGANRHPSIVTCPFPGPSPALRTHLPNGFRKQMLAAVLFAL